MSEQGSYGIKQPFKCGGGEWKGGGGMRERPPSTAGLHFVKGFRFGLLCRCIIVSVAEFKLESFSDADGIWSSATKRIGLHL